MRECYPGRGEVGQGDEGVGGSGGNWRRFLCSGYDYAKPHQLSRGAVTCLVPAINKRRVTCPPPHVVDKDVLPAHPRGRAGGAAPRTGYLPA